MLRRLETLTNADIRNAGAIRVFIEDEGLTEHLNAMPYAIEREETAADETQHVRPDLCIEVKTRADLKTVQNRVQHVLGEFIE